LVSVIPSPTPAQLTKEALIERGEYLATIGVCSACHTPPQVSQTPSDANTAAALAQDRVSRTDPDWVRHLDPNQFMAGGVPFILRFSKDASGTVYTRNITPDLESGLGSWTTEEIVEVIRTGKRKDGSALFLFAPHTFFSSLAEEDALALATYLQSLPPIYHPIPERSLPFPVQPATEITTLTRAPQGRTPQRADYLLQAIVGCRECHSHHEKDGTLVDFAGGNPTDPFIGVFRLGPDLPLRTIEKGFSAFPYPGYAVLYGTNLTRFGQGGDLEAISVEQLVIAMRRGISPMPDAYGRARPLGHVMMWQFYTHMQDDDAYAIADFLKTLDYIPNEVETPIYYGENWAAAFKQVYGEDPSPNDYLIFGKDAPETMVSTK